MAFQLSELKNPNSSCTRNSIWTHIVPNLDLSENILKGFISLFADDTRGTKVIKNKEDIRKMQNDLDKIYKWHVDNNRLFNTNKFELLRYGAEELKSSGYTKPDNIEEIEVKHFLRDLGVQMNDNGDFTDHVYKVCSKVNQKSVWILQHLPADQHIP